MYLCLHALPGRCVDVAACSHILAASLGCSAAASAEAGLCAVDEVADEREDDEEDDDDQEDDDVALHLGGGGGLVGLEVCRARARKLRLL